MYVLFIFDVCFIIRISIFLLSRINIIYKYLAVPFSLFWINDFIILYYSLYQQISMYNIRYTYSSYTLLYRLFCCCLNKIKAFLRTTEFTYDFIHCIMNYSLLYIINNVYDMYIIWYTASYFQKSYISQILRVHFYWYILYIFSWIKQKLKIDYTPNFVEKD